MTLAEDDVTLWIPHKVLDPICELRKGTADAVGWDLVAREDAYVGAGNLVAKVPCGVALEVPRGYEAQVRPRSGRSLEGIWVQLGTIDPDYRGEVSAIVANVGFQGDYPIRRGDRIAQLVIAPVPRVVFVAQDRLTPTARGEGGFGSTGSKARLCDCDDYEIQNGHRESCHLAIPRI